MSEPVFYYDFNSPYAYLAAHRVDELLPVRPRWQPIAFGFLLRETGRVPWSFDEVTRVPQMRDCEERAAALGLPLSWPADWPMGNYSLHPLRAALVAEEHGALREFSRAAYRRNFGGGEDLRHLEVVLDAAREAGLDPDAVRARMDQPEIKARLKEATDAAIAAGVAGVPTFRIGDELYWGDDRLSEAAAALAA